MYGVKQVILSFASKPNQKSHYMEEQIWNQTIGVYALELDDTIGLYQSNNFGLFFLFKDSFTAEKAIVNLNSWNERKIIVYQKHERVVKVTLHDNEDNSYHLDLTEDPQQEKLLCDFIRRVDSTMFFPLGACIIRDNEIIQAPERFVVQVHGYDIIR